MRYPNAIWMPWKHLSPEGYFTYYKGINDPVAVVLHVMEGWMSTVQTWARDGYMGASWHFSVARDGTVYQHLALTDGGYHAGIGRYRNREQTIPNPAPRWPLWRGWLNNVNHYTIGVEHEGLSGEPFTDAQARASKALCLWLAETLAIPLDRAGFTSHSEIALIDRPNDFNTPELREKFYAFLFSEDEVTKEEFEEFKRELANYQAAQEKFNNEVNGRVAALELWREQVVPVIDGHSSLIEAHVRAHDSGETDLPEHEHEPGQVVRK